MKHKSKDKKNTVTHKSRIFVVDDDSALIIRVAFYWA